MATSHIAHVSRACGRLAKAAAEFAQLSEYLSVHHQQPSRPEEVLDIDGTSLEALQCKATVANCVAHG